MYGIFIYIFIFTIIYIYLPTFYHRSKPIVDKYAGPINPVGLEFVIFFLVNELGGNWQPWCDRKV